MENLGFMEMETGRRFWARLPRNGDIIRCLCELADRLSVSTAAFRIKGTVLSFTVGVFDPAQQVYVTHTEQTACEIASCGGHLTLQAGKPFISASIALTDVQGRMTGGRLFSDTLVLGAELDFQEIRGPKVESLPDEQSGLTLFSLPIVCKTQSIDIIPRRKHSNGTDN
jgi:predicted DNA-binding protein with PD1-like motif